MTATLFVDALRRSFATIGFKVDSGAGKHDMLSVEMAEVESLTALKGKPIRVDAEQNRTQLSIVGTLDTAMPTSRHGISEDGMLFGLGASAVMRSGQPRVWQSARPFDIIASLVEPYGLGLEMETVVGTVPFLAQSSQSDWDIVNYVANRFGLSVFVSGTVLRVISMRREIRRMTGTRLPVFEVRFDKSRTQLIGNVKEYVGVETSTPVGYERMEFVGVDRMSGEMFKVVANEDATVSRTSGTHVATLGDAVAAKERAEQRRYNQLRCAIEVTGNLNAMAGTCVNVVSDGGERNTWIVTEASHELDREDFLTTLITLCRSEDDIYGPLSTPYFGQPPTPLNTGTAWRSNKQWKHEL